MSERSFPALVSCLVLLAGGLLACGPGSEPAPPEPAQAPAATPTPPAPAAAAVTAADRAAAQKIFQERCFTCHGVNGAGNGPASAGLTPQPRNFQDPEWQRSVTDEHIEKIIQYGGAAVGKSAAMPANPDLNDKPGLVRALVAYVRGLEAR